MGVTRRGHRPAHREKSVNLAFEAFVDDRNARLREPIGVGLALVEQRIESRGEYVGVGKPRMVGGAQRRGAPVGAIALVAKVLLLIPAQQIARERVAGREALER